MIERAQGVIGGALTEVQRDVLDFILDHQREHRYGPTHREIALRFGWSSFGTVHKHLRLLREKGWIVLTPNQKRGVQVREDVAAEALLVRCQALLVRVVEVGASTGWHSLRDVAADASRLLDDLAEVGIDDGWKEETRR